ncbi:MAG: MFS transporter [Burkholderiales bacterium]
MTTRTLNERYLIFTLAAVQFTYMMDFVVMMPLGPQLMRGLSIGAGEFSLLVSIYTLAAGLASLLAGFYIDRFDRRTTLLCLYAGFLTATLLCGLAPNYEALLVARACAGAIGGVMGSTIHSILGDAIPDNRRGAATGIVMSAFSVAAITGVPAGLWLASAFDWHAPFIMLTALSLVILGGVWRVVPALRGHLQPGAQKIHPLRQAQAVFSDANHRSALTLAAAMDFGGFLVVPFIGAYMIGNVGLEEYELPFLYLFGGLTTVFTSRWIGRLADRYGKKQVFTSTVCIALIPLLTLTHLPPAPLWVAVCTMVAFMVFFSGRFVSAMALINSSAQPSLRGSFLSFNAAIQQFSLSVAALAGGYIIGTTESGALANFGAAGILSAAIAILSIALAWRVKPVG